MKLRHMPRSPFVRKVGSWPHEKGLAERIELVPTALSPVQRSYLLGARKTR
jgi:glutathione S-transferase